MAKIGEKLVTYQCMGTRMANESKKLLKDILSLASLDDREIATGF